MAAPFFKHESWSEANFLDTVASIGEPLRVGHETILYQAGEPATKLYVVTEGAVRTLREYDQNELQLSDTVARRGQMVGIEAIEGGGYDSAAIVLEPGEVISLSREDVTTAMLTDPEGFIAALEAQTMVQERKFMLTSRGTTVKRLVAAITNIYGSKPPEKPDKKLTGSVAGVPARTLDTNIGRALWLMRTRKG